jgi:multiple sugar transport system permease protein
MGIKGKRFNGRERREIAEGYCFIAPVFVHLSFFVIVPIISAFIFSFQKWNLLIPQMTFVGFANFIRLFKDDIFLLSLKQTLQYSIWTVPVGMVFSLLTALVLKRKSLINNFYRTCFFLPVIVSLVVTSVVFLWLFDPMIGLINYYFIKAGLPRLLWLSDPNLAMPTLIIISIWKNMGYNMVIFLAGLQAIPDIYYEASTIDGAGTIRQFFRITLPLLKPTTLFILVMSVMGSFQVFDQVYLMTNGGPVNRTKVIVFYIYETAFYFFDMGYATALSVALFLMTLFLTIAQFKLFSNDSYA